MNNEGMIIYNLYKEKFYPGLFKYSIDVVHGIVYFKKKKLLLIAGNEGFFNLYKLEPSKDLIK